MARKNSQGTNPAMLQREAKSAKSIQAEAKRRGGKSYISRLNDETKKFAYNYGTPWSEDNVEDLVSLVSSDKTTYEIALATGRTFYSAQTARSHVRFAMNHAAAFRKVL